jgi:hypothetical protein
MPAKMGSKDANILMAEHKKTTQLVISCTADEHKIPHVLFKCKTQPERDILMKNSVMWANKNDSMVRDTFKE